MLTGRNNVPIARRRVGSVTLWLRARDSVAQTSEADPILMCMASGQTIPSVTLAVPTKELAPLVCSETYPKTKPPARNQNLRLFSGHRVPTSLPPPINVVFKPRNRRQMSNLAHLLDLASSFACAARLPCRSWTTAAS